METGSKTVATDIEVRSFRDADWPAVRTIYAQGIATGNATFETEVPAFDRWAAAHAPQYRFVAILGGDIVG
jgi:L-amino acid N-acyltransferase YncA